MIEHYCDREGAASCKGCPHSFDPSLYDGGCKLLYEAQRAAERAQER